MKRILVVDGDQVNLNIVSTVLSESSFNVLTYDTGFNVIENVKNFSPDVILLDIKLPGVCGIEICKKLKSFFSIPILLFSAHEDSDAALKNCGAEAYIQKPIDRKKFVSLISFFASYKMAEG